MSVSNEVKKYCKSSMEDAEKMRRHSYEMQDIDKEAYYDGAASAYEKIMRFIEALERS